MTDPIYPPNWNHDYDIGPDVVRLVLRGECGLLQATIQVGFALATLLLSFDDESLRVTVAETLAAKLIETARTGRLPGEVMQ